MSNFNRFEILDSIDLAESYTITDSYGKKTTVRVLPACPCGNLCKSNAEEQKLIREGIVKKYQEQVKKSRGFDIIDYPGFIPNVTNIVPRQYVIDNRVKYPEEYDNIMDMAALAIWGFNAKHQDKNFNFKVASIQKLNVEGCNEEKTTYYITFGAVNVKKETELVKSNFFDKFLRTCRIIMLMFLYLLCLINLLPWKRSLGAKLLMELKILENLKASEQELNDKKVVIRGFQAKVRDDNKDMRREVLFCKAKFSVTLM